MEVGRFLANSNDNNAKQHSIIKPFFLIFIPLAALITLLFYGLIAIDNQLELVTLKERELGQAQVAARLLENEGYIDIGDLNSEQNFAKSYHQEWNIMQNSPQGAFETKKGLFVFTTLYPLLSSKSKAEVSSVPSFHSNNDLSGTDYYWKTVSFIPKSELPHFSLTRHPKTLGFYLLSLSIIGALAAYLAYALAQRREILHKLEHYAAEANDLYENAPVGYHSLDGKGTYIRINSTELKWLGYSREEVVGKMRVTDLLTPTGLRIFNEQFPRFKEKGFVHDLEFELIRKDGTQFTVLLNATAIYDKNHKYLASRTIMVDITRRKQIEYALRESEERFRNTMDNAPIGMATISIDGKFIRVNETLARVLGYHQSELEETSIQDITYPQDINADEAQIHELKAGKISHYKCEKRFIRKNGEVIWVQLTSSAVRSNLRNSLYYVAQIEDISERKVYQESVHHLAYHDTLTNLPNRRLFYDELDKAIHTAKLSEQNLAVMYVDIDYFKSINDTLGHDMGDELLKVIAARLTGEVRDTDMVARTGGDEFVILLAKISSYKDAELIANSIITSLRVPIYLRDTKLKVTVSIGIATFPNDANQAKILMKQADQAMYAAKNAGKDQYLTYSDCKDSIVVDRD